MNPFLVHLSFQALQSLSPRYLTLAYSARTGASLSSTCNAARDFLGQESDELKLSAARAANQQTNGYVLRVTCLKYTLEHS